MTNLEKFLDNSLSFLNIPWVRWSLIVLVVLYITGLVPMFTSEVSSIFRHPLVQLLFLVLIVYIALKDLPLALLLAIAFVLSMLMGYGVNANLSLGPGFGFNLGGSVSRGSQNVASASAGANIETLANDNDSSIPHGGDYNQYFDCVNQCNEGDVGKGPLNSPCRSVAVWNPELNAQGLNCPLGYSGEKVGRPLNMTDDGLQLSS